MNVSRFISETKDGIVLYSVIAKPVFFSLIGAFGFASSEKLENASSFTMFVSTLGMLAILITCWDILRGRIVKNRAFWVFAILLPLIFIADVTLEQGLYDMDDFIGRVVSLMLGFSFASIFCALYIAAKGIRKFAKWIDPYTVVNGIASLGAVINIVGGGTIDFGGSAYQDMAYITAYAFGLNLCMILFGNKFDRFSIFRNEVYTKVCYVILVIQLLACILSGGRGGLIVIIVSSVLMLYFSRRIKKVAAFLVLFLALAYMLTIFYGDSGLAAQLERGLNRIFSYISEDGINLGKASGRDISYSNAIDHIQAHHFCGGGLLKSDYDVGGYPHNMFLEMLMQGGILYLVVWLVVFVKESMKIKWLASFKSEYLLIPTLCFSMLYLMFSGTYLYNGEFWFCLVYAFARTEWYNRQDTLGYDEV